MKGVYLLHFEPKYRHAGHYLGYADDITRRVEEHRKGKSRVPLTEAASLAGVTMMLVKTWKNKGRFFERKLKGKSSCRSGSLARICPACLAMKAAAKAAVTA